MRFGLSTELIGAMEAAQAFELMAERGMNFIRPLTRLCQYHVRKARRILAGGERGLRSRSRELEGSLTYAFANPNEALVGSNLEYAGSQQSGPRKGFYESSRPGGFLAVPIADNIGAGQQAKYASPREVTDGFFIHPNDGPALFVRRRGGKKLSDKLIKFRSAFHKAMSNVTPLREIFEILFILLARVADRARNDAFRGRYVTHDPEDEPVWNEYAFDWVLKGR